MKKNDSISSWLDSQSPFVFGLWCMIAAFITYFSMYAFRKPFSAGVYTDLVLWGIQYKIILIISQVLGYTFSKFLGIKIVSEMRSEKRAFYILILIGISWSALLGLALVPYPYNFLFMFLNGLPLGMIWGLVFAFLEGRKYTELLAVGLATSFIVASGVVKSIGLELVINGIDEFWMPFITGLFFVPSLFLGVWMLTKISPPTLEDENLRTRRSPMNKKQRIEFFKEFAPGIIIMTLIYIALNAYRDFRDNFAVEIWQDLGYADQPEILAYAELPIAISVLIIIGLMIFIRNNRLAFYLNIVIIFFAGISVLVTTIMFKAGDLDPAFWMIFVGFGMYLAYIAYTAVLFERWIALFKYVSNVGFLIYICDSFGYLGSVGVILYQNFFAGDLSWLDFFLNMSLVMGLLSIGLSLLAWIYFRWKEKRYFLHRNISN